MTIPAPPPAAWSWTSDGWTRLTPDGKCLEYGGDGPEPVLVGYVIAGGGGGGSPVRATDRAPLAPWRRWLLRLLRRGYPR